MAEEKAKLEVGTRVQAKASFKLLGWSYTSFVSEETIGTVAYICEDGAIGVTWDIAKCVYDSGEISEQPKTIEVMPKWLIQMEK